MKYVVLSSTTSNVYDFFLPIAAKVWRERIGYEPIMFLVGTKGEWNTGHCDVALGELEANGHTVTFVSHVVGVDDSNVAMSVRQHAAALYWLKDDDILLVGDVDLLPVRSAFYHQNDQNQYPLVIHHSNMYEDRYWPAYGPAMSVGSWREVMGLVTGNLMGSLLKTFRDGRIHDLVAAQKADSQDSRLWVFDEQYASARIRESGLATRILKIPSSAKERLCRHAWPVAPRAEDYIDCHCPRPGWTAESWVKIRAFLAQIMPSDLPWLDRYIALYRGTIPPSQLF